MTRAAQTDLAVLAALSLGPMTGYALREAVHEHLGAFWSESFGQIYPALARLRTAGFVDDDPGSRPGSSIHRLTDAGRTRLVELMREPPTPVAPRNGMLLRLFFGQVLGPQACAELVTEYRDRAAATLAELAHTRAQLDAEPPTEQTPYGLMTLSAGEHTARAAIAWADETLAALAALDRR